MNDKCSETAHRSSTPSRGGTDSSSPWSWLSGSSPGLSSADKSSRPASSTKSRPASSAASRSTMVSSTPSKDSGLERSSLTDESNQAAEQSTRRPLFYDRETIIRDIVQSVKEERMAYWRPIVEALAEKHYYLLRQAVALGLVDHLHNPFALDILKQIKPQPQQQQHVQLSSSSRSCRRRLDFSQSETSHPTEASQSKVQRSESPEMFVLPEPMMPPSQSEAGVGEARASQSADDDALRDENSSRNVDSRRPEKQGEPCSSKKLRRKKGPHAAEAKRPRVSIKDDKKGRKRCLVVARRSGSKTKRSRLARNTDVDTRNDGGHAKQRRTKPGTHANYMSADRSLVPYSDADPKSLLEPISSVVPTNEAQESSGLLVELKKRFLPGVGISDVPNHMTSVMCTCEGSRFFQEHLPQCSSTEKSLLFEQISGSLFGLACNMFGNYVVQKFLEVSLPGQRSRLFFIMMFSNIKVLWTNKHGTRVFQSMLRYLAKHQLLLVCEKMLENLELYCKDVNACHIVLRCVEYLGNMSNDLLEKIVEELESCAHDVVLNPNGVKIVQKVLYLCPDYMKAGLKARLLDHTGTILTRESGCSIVQFLYEHGSMEDRKIIMQTCLPRLEELACHKWGSQPLHTLLKLTTCQERAGVLSIMVEARCLAKMLINKYARALLERLVEVCEIEQLKELHDQLLAVLGPVPDKIVARIKESIQDTVRSQCIIDMASSFLTRRPSLQAVEKFGSSLSKLQPWMVAIFKGDILELSSADIPLLILGFHTIGEPQDGPALAILKFAFQKYLKRIINRPTKRSIK